MLEVATADNAFVLAGFGEGIMRAISILVAGIGVLLPLQAFAEDLTEAQVTKLLSGRTIMIARGPATFGADGSYHHPNGKFTSSTWTACGSAVCLATGWRGPLSAEGNIVYLTYPNGKKFNMGRKP